MTRYITVDSGTTNTRIYLVENGEITDTARLAIGCSSKESRARLTKELKAAISMLISSHGLKETDITRIIASGMIGSEFGLLRLEHITAPAGISELKAGSHETILDEISTIPFFFIPGVKTAGKTLLDFDMMRGEETELMGLLDGDCGEYIYVLPGSHSKIIKLDGRGRITDFKTTLSGEMIAALSKHTILSSAVSLDSTLSEKALIEGYEFTRTHGINLALFKPRILKNIMKKDASHTYSFFLGSLLCDEIKLILSMPETKVVIGGRDEIKKALAILIRAASNKEVTVIESDTVSRSTPRGAVKIFEYK